MPLDDEAAEAGTLSLSEDRLDPQREQALRPSVQAPRQLVGRGDVVAHANGRRAVGDVSATP